MPLCPRCRQSAFEGILRCSAPRTRRLGRGFFLSAKEIADHLDRTDEDLPRFIVGTLALDPKFRVANRRQALDRIEHEIAIRSSAELFVFLDRVNIPFRKVSENDIDYRYTLPIPNSQADIPKTYFQYRDRLRSLIWDMEEALKVIDTIMQTPDPRVALAELEKLDEYRGGSGSRDYLMFRGYKCDLDWPYLSDALDEHEKRTKALEDAGLLAPFVALSSAVKEQIARKAKKFEGVAKDGQTLWASLDYDPKTLTLSSVNVKLLKKGDQKPKAKLAKSVLLHAWGRQDAPSVVEADNLWHSLMTAVLETVCPGVTEQ